VPRLTNNHYLYRHASLKTVWRSWPDLFGLLTPTQQQQLHNYYRPRDRPSPEELLAHRRQLDRDQPALGSQAGKAFMVLHRAFQEICETYPESEILDGLAVQHYLALRHPPTRQRPKTTVGGRHISVRPVMLAKPDLPLLAKALIRLAEDQHAREDASEHPERSDAA
jgi:hypothetical protein